MLNSACTAVKVPVGFENRNICRGQMPASIRSQCYKSMFNSNKSLTFTDEDCVSILISGYRNNCFTRAWWKLIDIIYLDLGL